MSTATGRRAVAALLGALLAAAAVVAVAPQRPDALGQERNGFVSRTDLHPPALDVTTASTPADSYIMLTPSVTVTAPPPPGVQNGALIVDGSGAPVWFAPTSAARQGDTRDVATNLKVQRYRGRDVLTYWRGELSIPPGSGAGRYVILDSSYREIATVRAGNGLQADLHEMLLTDRGTALITAYDVVEGPNGDLIDGVIQEIDVDTGRVVWQWRSLDHVPVAQTHQPLDADGPGSPLDYFHINSVDVDADGNLLVSARHTSAIYKVDRRTGDVIWTMGGTDSDFTMGPGAEFGYQHDVRRLPDGSISLFDNGEVNDPQTVSRALVLDVDTDRKTVRLARQYPNPGGLLAFSQGDAQHLAGGNVFVGWGSLPELTEFDADGDVVFEATFGSTEAPGLNSYRAYRFAWTGRPADPPAVAVGPGSASSALSVYASWNGSTEVAAWRVLAGTDPAGLTPAGQAARSGFETMIPLSSRAPYVAVQALDAGGRVLATSATVPTDG